MNVLLEIHLVVAFLLALCAIIFSWNAAGRRVVNAVAGLQFLVGVIAAIVMGAHPPLPPQVWVHLIIALLVMAAYGMAMRFSKRAGGNTVALVLSIVGLLLVLWNIYLGWTMAGGVSSL